ncbi:thioredoxin family protein [Sphingobacterium corticibacterium]|uniref:Thioredoxin family protein n=1 Tax=Sphingobacterium corticibacterium TaxID=2484746 RepID=A0A4Q6XN45_9SPHI|nr:thioredoxin family protein [Sphingobacterium corticibacterium]RZF57969.1 thioredoxin family protein [Sphingobacterium corticibacterium]
MRRFGLVMIMIFCLGGIATAQTESFAIEDIDSIMQTQKKPILILLSTDWCKYCQMQKGQLAKNKDFQKQADNFYYIVFNAERKHSIVFNQKTFQHKATGLSSGIHELAIALSGSENITFPTWVLLDSRYQVLFRYSGVLKPLEIRELLKAIEESR